MSQDLAAIATTNLTKRYGGVTALDGIDLSVPRGVTYGFLGPNGAGKTTTIRLLMGFIRPTAGSARIDGHDCWRDGVRARADLGYLVPAEALYPDMTGEALLAYVGALSGKPITLRDALLDALELSRRDLRRRLNTYSKGMKQKLALTAAMQTNPSLLILDEPTDGLDPLIQRAFESVLADLHGHGTTIFMSSHDLAEVERTCERVAIIRDGRIAAEETIGDLKALRRRIAEITFAGPAPEHLAEIPGVHLVRRDGNRLTLSVEGGIAPLLRYLASRDDVADLLLAPPRLEEIFLDYYDMTPGPSGGGDGTPGAAVAVPLKVHRP
ncbi:MAG: ABC transporter ATP-binding protein [Thermomicrobiales bacterium]|nr:ABC transporter ATP-binding protein [Thermomicrobiales bacterium]